MNSRTFIVTGASRGIGSALTRNCLARGHSVIAVARHVEPLRRMAEKEPNLDVVRADLSKFEDIEHLAERLLLLSDADPVLVNNAAVQDDWPFSDERNNPGSVAQEVTLNLTAPIILTRALVRNARGRRSIVVNIQSLLALAPKRTAAVYSATKGGLRLFSKGLDRAGQARRLRVIDIYMPLVDTDMAAGRGSGKISADVAAEFVLEAIDTRRRIVHVGKARLVAALYALHPRLASALLGRM